MTGLYRPGPTRSRQLLVTFHGHGSRPDQIHPWFRCHHEDGFLRVCPQGEWPTDDGWSWFPTGPRGVPRADLDRAVDRVIDLVSTTATELGVAWDDVVLAGFSQGGAMAVAVAARLAERGQGLGGLLLQSAFVPEPDEGEIAVAAITAPSALVQCAAGDEVVPPFLSTDLAAMLQAGNVDDVVVHELAGDHRMSTAMVDDAQAWLGGFVPERDG